MLKCFFHFLASGFLSNSIGAILRILVDKEFGYGISASFQGLLSGLFSFGALVAILLFGYLPHWLGLNKTFRLLMLFPIAGFVCMLLTGNPLFLIASFLFMGMGKGLASSACNLIANIGSSNNATTQNLLHSSFAIGAITSPIMISLFEIKDWKSPVIIIASLLCLTSFLFGYSNMEDVKKDKKDSRNLGIDKSISFPKSVDFWISTLILTFYVCCESNLMAYLVSYFSIEGLFDNSFSMVLSGLLWATILCGRLLTVLIVKKVRKETFILFLGFGFALAFLLLISASTAFVAVLGLLLTGLCMSGIYPTTMSTHKKEHRESTLCTSICIATTIVGSTLMPIISGLIVDHRHSYKAGLSALWVPMIAMIILMIIKFTRSKRET